MSADPGGRTRRTAWERFRSWPVVGQVLMWWFFLPIVLAVWVAHEARGRSASASVVLGLGAFLLVAVVPLLLYAWASASAHESMFPAVDDPVLAERIDAPCPLEPSTTGAPARQVVGEENAALDDFVEALENLDAERVADDPPVADWINDWQVLLAARVDYYRRLHNRPDADRPPMPSVDGDSIAVRMSEMDGVECAPR